MIRHNVNSKQIKYKGYWWNYFHSVPKKTYRIPVSPGVYMITIQTTPKKRKLLYIGCSQCLPRRLNAHNILRLLHKNTKLKIEVFFITCPTVKDSRIFEKTLLIKLLPVFNFSASKKCQIFSELLKTISS